ncbi:hypothetical protein CAMRE0001_2149 [Campylobacter rectus RM3267]|uniref:Uncharacterized protein n=1 Tax=Campylobacter rectus RM3267 TaxID=553218 RepID=B9D453_CAMRE|nr:hypothetical protein CAMRE0001_2149 [Campylobacter rectus RM3267]
MLVNLTDTKTLNFKLCRRVRKKILLAKNQDSSKILAP